MAVNVLSGVEIYYLPSMYFYIYEVAFSKADLQRKSRYKLSIT